jgi:dihydrofolate reductase
MRKLKWQVQLTVDGFMGRENGGLDWMTWNITKDRADYILKLHDNVDTILLGRKMTDGFINYWENVPADSPENDFAKIMLGTPKVVFTKTLNQSKWNNTTVANGPLAEEINKLKQQKGKDIIVYGGAGFVSNLVKENLIDDYYLFVNPAAISSGLNPFSSSGGNMKLSRVETAAFDDGVVLLHYQPKKN